MSKKYPATKAVKFVLCEDVREEAHQKLSLLGVYPADSVTVVNPTPPPSGSGVALLASLAIVVVIKDLQGEFGTRLKVVAPDGETTFDEAMGTIQLTHRGAATLTWKIQGFIVPKFGRFRAELHLDDRSYPFEFEILNGAAVTANPMQAPKARKHA